MWCLPEILVLALASAPTSAQTPATAPFPAPAATPIQAPVQAPAPTLAQALVAAQAPVPVQTPADLTELSPKVVTRVTISLECFSDVDPELRVVIRLDYKPAPQLPNQPQFVAPSYPQL